MFKVPFPEAWDRGLGVKNCSSRGEGGSGGQVSVLFRKSVESAEIEEACLDGSLPGEQDFVLLSKVFRLAESPEYRGTIEAAGGQGGI